MKEKVMYFFALILSSTLMFGQDNILDYLDKKDVFPDSVIPFAQISSIPENVVLDYLCNTRNDCFINPYNGYKLRYYPICKVDVGNDWLLMYYVSDGYSIDCYIASYIESEGKIAYKIHVYSSIGGDPPTIFYKLKGDKIEIFRKIKGDLGEGTIHQTYGLDSSLSLIASNVLEVDLIQIQPEKILYELK